MSFNFPTTQKIVLSDRQIDYNPKDDITIHLDSNDISLLNGKNSFLRFSVKLAGTMACELDKNGGGGHSVLERISIYSGDGGTLLEQLEDYPAYIGTRNYFDKTSGSENMRQLLEGLPNNGEGVPVLASPYFKFDALGTPSFTYVEVCLPLYMSGVLYGDQAFPVIATNGLMIKIHLAEAEKAIRLIGNADDKRPGFVNSRFLGTGNAGATAAATIADLPTQLGGYGGAAGIATGARGGGGVVPAGEVNVAIDAPNCFQVAGNVAQGDLSLTIGTAIAANALAPANIANIDAATIKPNVNAPTDNTLFPYSIGQNLYVLGDNGVVFDAGAITNITFGANVYNIFFTNAIGAANGVCAAAAANRNPVWVNVTPAQARAANLTYSIRDVQLVCSVVEPPPQYFQAIMKSMKTTSGYEMDIKTFNLYRNNLYANRSRNQELIPTTEFRARALLHLQLNPALNFLTSFYKPVSDYLRQYQYTIRNRLIPQLPVDTNKEILPGYRTWNAVADAERIKMLEATGIEVKDELRPAGHFVFGRQVAKAGHSANLNGIDVRITQDWGITLNANQGQVAPQQEKLLYTYVRHFRKIAMRPGNVVVSY
jgi:hypothetical protein